MLTVVCYIVFKYDLCDTLNNRIIAKIVPFDNLRYCIRDNSNSNARKWLVLVFFFLNGLFPQLYAKLIANNRRLFLNIILLNSSNY